MARQRYFEEYTDPYDILKLILNYVDSDAGTCLHLATKVNNNWTTKHSFEWGANLGGLEE